MGGRNAHPVDLLIAGGKSHLTKSDIEHRKKAEIKLGNDKLKCPAYIKNNVIAYAKWKEIIAIYDGTDIISSADIGLLGRYCITFAEYRDLLERRQRIDEMHSDSDDLNDYINDSEEFDCRIKKQLIDIVSTDGILRIDTAINKKMDMLALNVGLCSSSVISTAGYMDGVINAKSTAGTVIAKISDSVPYIGRGVTNAPSVLIGNSEEPESLDSYISPNPSITIGVGTVVSVFDETLRTLKTTIMRPFTNSSGSASDITEAGITIQMGNYQYLFVRDVFSAIAVANGQTITWTYTTEVAFPNP